MVKFEAFIKKYARVLLGIFAVILILYDGSGFIKNLSLGTTLHVLRSFKASQVFGFILISLVAFGLTASYDLVFIRHLGIHMKWNRILKVSWISNSFNNIAGMGGLGGMGARLLLYKSDGISEKQIRTMGFTIIPATVTGLGLLMAMNVTGVTDIGSLIHAYRWTPILIAVYILFVPFYCWFTEVRFSRFQLVFKHHEDHSESRLRMNMTLVSAMDWCAAVFVLWSIAASLMPGLTYLQMAGLFSVSAAAGIVSMIPGGFGSFDLMLLTGLGLHGMSSDKALAVLLLFRFFYYLLPLAIGAVLAMSEALPRSSKWLRRFAGLLHIPESGKEIESASAPSVLLGSVASKGLYVLVVGGGILLILSAATPGLPERIKFMKDLLEMPMLQLSHRISLFMGLMIIMVSDDVRLGIRRSWSLCLALLVLGGASTFIKGFDFEELLYLLCTFVLLSMARPAFGRTSAPMNISRMMRTFFLTGTMALAYILMGQPHAFSFSMTHPALSMLHFTPDDYVVNGLGALALSWICYAIWIVLMEKPVLEPLPSTEQDYARLDAFLTRYGGNVHAHLLYMGDKRFFWYGADEGMVPYQQSGNALVALGEPLGDPGSRVATLEEFRKYAERYGYSTVLYQVPDNWLSVLHDQGFDFFKLGEEAFVVLDEFNIETPAFRSFRNVRNRVEKAGYVFEMLEPTQVEEHFHELKHISDIWLAGRSEKKFSLGYFDEAYVKRSPVAVVRNDQGDMVAFASMMPTYRGKEEISVDLMRFIPDGPNGLMDYLFLKLLLWAKEAGYGRFNFGMAPLSNVGQKGFPTTAERLAGFLYTHGGRFYSFAGLYQYKRKFHPNWRSRYLAYPRHANLSSVIMSVTELINTGRK